MKEALGPRWAAVAARAMSSAEHVIRHRCGSHDTWSRTADGGFLICFATATEDEAAFRASAMAREIRNRLIGEGETEATATVSAMAAAVDVPQDPGRSGDMLATVIGERLNSRLAEIEARARDTLRRTVHSTSCRLEPVRDRRTRSITAHFARLPLEQEQQILAAYSTLPANERQNFDFDRLVLGVAANQAISELAQGGGLLVLLNVDFEVFLDRRRTELYRGVPGARQPAEGATHPRTVRSAERRPQEPRPGLRHAVAPVLSRHRLPVRQHGGPLG